MQELIKNIISSNIDIQRTLQKNITDYSGILKTYGLNYVRYGSYWQVGEFNQAQGWILDLSVIKIQIIDLLHIIIPELISRNISFQVIQNSREANLKLCGGLDHISAGRIVSIYLPTDEGVLELAERLIELTKLFRGPVILTDRHLGSIVYTRYGSFKPLWVKHPLGQFVRCIYDPSGRLIPEPFTIPFILPEGVSWPFGKLADPQAPARNSKLLNNKYYPVSILKPDIRGRVIKALYFKKLWRIAPCVIKQGRINMLSDDAGRDIEDRLKWQYELHQKLGDDIPLPKIFDFFRENNSIYLAMEFVNGISLTKWIENAYQNRCWLDLTISEQLQLLDQLLVILSIVHRMHRKGVVHRDLTPENFLIDKKNRIHVLDLELAWSVESEQPDPPFDLGTTGFMSPEQQAIHKPTFKEDIYALGSLMVVVFTNLPPVKLDLTPGRLPISIVFFTGEQQLAECIASCRQLDAAKRPELPSLINTLKQYKQNLPKKRTPLLPSLTANELSVEQIQMIIRAGLQGLSHTELLDPINGESIFRQNQSQKKDVFPSLSLLESWHTGVSGFSWLLATAKNAGYNIDSCRMLYTHSWDWTKEHYFKDPNELEQGLYFGRAGIGQSIVEGLNAGILLQDETTIDYLRRCFTTLSPQLNLSSGIAGQGIALINSLSWLDGAEEMLNDCVAKLIDSQQKDGSWNISTLTGKKKDILTGMDEGIAGITWFLLAHVQKYKTEAVYTSCTKAMSWLIRTADKKGKNYSWAISTKSKSINQWSLGYGIPGITLLFIKAYEALQDRVYFNIAEATLASLPDRPVKLHYGLGNGLTGLGEMYLEAFRVFKNPIWRERAEWIAKFFIHTYQGAKEKEVYWITSDSNNNDIKADLFTGMSGILHFLIRYSSENEINHPLTPKVL